MRDGERADARTGRGIRQLGGVDHDSANRRDRHRDAGASPRPLARGECGTAGLNPAARQPEPYTNSVAFSEGFVMAGRWVVVFASFMFFIITGCGPSKPVAAGPQGLY